MLYLLYSTVLYKGEIMKKIYITLSLLLLFLCGCSSTQVNNPYEICVKNEIFSYYNNKEDIPEFFNVLDISIKNHQDENNNVLVNQDGKIRSISIVDKNITTYKQISVGDNISKVQNNFSNVYTVDDIIYTVTFDGNIEKDNKSTDKKEDWIYINYITKDSIITRIVIYDAKYGSEMR